MRRSDRELKSREEIEKVIDESDVCRLAFSEDEEGFPYILPLNFGYLWQDGLQLFFHSAADGKKVKLIESQGKRVAFEMDTRHQLVTGPIACAFSMRYASVMGRGHIEVLEDLAGKRQGLDRIMAHYGFPGQPDYAEAMLGKTFVYKLVVEAYSAKEKA